MMWKLSRGVSNLSGGGNKGYETKNTLREFATGEDGFS